MGLVGAKIGTKTWSDAPQNEIQRDNGVRTRSATDDAFNGADMGEVLNKLSDPNYVDPSKKIRAVGSDKMDKDAFMKLMLAQMKNQDPTNPMKSHEMAAQLAQFSGLEQMQNMNSTLTEMKNGQKPTENFQALNFIGKAVAGDSAHITRMKGDKDHEFNFELPDAAKSVVLKIRNSEGEVVRTMDAHDLKKGPNKIVWNGKNEKGATTPVGEYQIFAEATTSANKKLALKTDFNGIITGINYSPEGPVLLVGNQSVKLKDVKKIVDPSIQSQVAPGQVGAAPAPNDLNKAVVAPQSKDDDEGAQDKKSFGGPINNLESVGMTHDMAEKVSKETRPDSAPARPTERGKGV